jgi:hypothetical protein
MIVSQGGNLDLVIGFAASTESSIVRDVRVCLFRPLALDSLGSKSSKEQSLEL